MDNDKYYIDAWYKILIDDETGDKYWSGGGDGDKDVTNFDNGEPLVIDPGGFEEGTVIKCYRPIMI